MLENFRANVLKIVRDFLYAYNSKIFVNLLNSVYSHFLKIFTLYIVRKQYNNKEEEKKKMEISSLVGSVRWSEELSFRADHRYIMRGNKWGLHLVSWQLWMIMSVCIVNFGS